MDQLLWMIDFLPDWFWTILLILGIILLLAGWLLKKIPIIKNYSIPINILGVVFTLSGVYFQGVVANENKWIQRIDELEEEVKIKEEQMKAATEKLAAETQAKNNVILEAGAKQAELSGKLNTALKAAAKNPNATPQTIIQDLSAEEKKKYENMNSQQKTEYESKIADLIKNAKECPIVPSLIIEKLNEAAQPPIKGDKK